MFQPRVFDLDARKASALLALRISIAAVVALWPDADREAAARADEKFLSAYETDLVHVDAPTTAYTRGRTIRAAPLMCPHCLADSRAQNGPESCRRYSRRQRYARLTLTPRRNKQHPYRSLRRQAKATSAVCPASGNLSRAAPYAARLVSLPRIHAERDPNSLLLRLCTGRGCVIRDGSFNWAQRRRKPAS